MKFIRRLLRQDPPIEDPNTVTPDEDGSTDIYTLELAAILLRLDMQDDEDDTANFDLIEQEYE